MAIAGDRLDGDDLLERLAEIARDLADADDLDATLQRIVDRAHQFIANCDGVSMMMVRRGGVVSSPAFSSRIAYDSDLVQYETGEGPCLESMAERDTFIIDDLEADDRWPAYRRRALDLGVRSMLSVRLFVADDTMGALDLYSQQPHAFDDRSRALGQVFAAHAAIAMKAAIAEAGLEDAIASRDVIGQAKGVLIERERLTGEQAYQRLRDLSQKHNIKVRDLAHDIATTGHIPD